MVSGTFRATPTSTDGAHPPLRRGAIHASGGAGGAIAEGL